MLVRKHYKKIAKILVVFSLLLNGVFILKAHSANIYVYNDDGVSEESLAQTIATFHQYLGAKYAIKSLSAAQVKKGMWVKDAAAFIMPGGADLPYATKLNGLGNKNIKKYVKNGGVYIGICAGAYYAASYVEFDKGGKIEVLGNRELKLFQGKAIGPILAPYNYATNSGSIAAEITTIFKNIPIAHIYYNGGGFFESNNNFPNTKVIAQYAKNKLPAIVFINYGQGKVLLSGVHFEYDTNTLPAKDKHTKNVIAVLGRYAADRKSLVNSLLGTLSL